MSAALQVRDGGGDHTMTGFQARDAGNTDRTITEGRIIGPDKVDRVFWDPSGSASFTASASPSRVQGFGISTITTNSSTVTPTGGTSPYSYSWSVVSYTNATSAPTINSPTSATSTFTQTNVEASSIDGAIFLCTVTDSATPPNTATVSVSAQFADNSGL